MFGDDHINTLRTKTALGSNLQDRGRFEEAESHYREGLGHKRCEFGNDQPSTLSAVNNLADFLFAQDKSA